MFAEVVRDYKVHEGKKECQAGERKSKNERSTLISNPSRAALGDGTFMVTKGFLCREKAATVVAGELADFAVFCYFMSQSIVLS